MTTYTLDKSCTSKLYVERVAHNGILILTDNETGISMRYMGYGIQQAKILNPKVIIPFGSNLFHLEILYSIE